MVSLALMAKLLAALKPDARLVLVGDQDQLPPVDAGNVLGDLCRAAAINGFSENFRNDYKRCSGETLDEKLFRRRQADGHRDSTAHELPFRRNAFAQ
jgi:exodeoxyribonuclease V alpha subunit